MIHEVVKGVVKVVVTIDFSGRGDKREGDVGGEGEVTPRFPPCRQDKVAWLTLRAGRVAGKSLTHDE